MSISAARESQLLEAVNALLDARRTSTPIADFPVELRPTTVEEAYFCQDAMAQAYGPVGGYKIGAPNGEATPMYAPMPLAWIAAGGSLLSGSQWRYRGLEAEIAFQLGHDLPARATPYSREEALAAVGSCHPVIEVLESGLTDPMAVDKFAGWADMQMHGGLVYGPAVAGWETIDWNAEKVTLAPTVVWNRSEPTWIGS